MLSYMSGIHIKICRALSSALKNLPDERIGIKAAGSCFRGIWSGQGYVWKDVYVDILD